MFLNQTVRNNPGLIEFAFWAQQNKKLLPDSYIIDVDMFMDNASKMMEKSRVNGIKLYYMLKQAGRNPILAQILADMGFGSAVAVDYKEALLYVRHHIPLGNVGHLVQVPEGALETIMDTCPEIMTVYSYDKAKSISDTALQKGFVQPVMARIVDKEDFMYPGQFAGIPLDELHDFAGRLSCLKGVKLSGVCGFPCLLYNDEKKEIQPTHNAHTVVSAAKALCDMGFDIEQINLASANCIASVDMVKSLGGTHMEPGHGLLGTTPAHVDGGEEKQAMVYMSEISHSFNGNSYCYGGGFYRRGNLKSALVGKNMGGSVRACILPPDMTAIDYHLGMKGIYSVGDCAVMSFRSQVFVTRSYVAPVKGIKNGSPEIMGVFDSFGNRLE